MRATLILGSNLGRREAALERARELLCESLGPCVAASPVVETPAVGFDGPAFLNQIVCYECSLEPLELLHLCKRIEVAMGRDLSLPLHDEAGRRIYHSRIIDIDILLLGELALDTPELTIPHPQLDSRPHVRPLLDSVK